MTKILMEQWVIYYNPDDYPGKYVVRKWHITANKLSPEVDAIITESLDKARAAIPPNLYIVPRFQDDDPTIVEVWL